MVSCFPLQTRPSIAGVWGRWVRWSLWLRATGSLVSQSRWSCWNPLRKIDQAGGNFEGSWYSLESTDGSRRQILWKFFLTRLILETIGLCFWGWRGLLWWPWRISWSWIWPWWLWLWAWGSSCRLLFASKVLGFLITWRVFIISFWVLKISSTERLKDSPASDLLFGMAEEAHPPPAPQAAWCPLVVSPGWSRWVGRVKLPDRLHTRDSFSRLDTYWELEMPFVPLADVCPCLLFRRHLSFKTNCSHSQSKNHGKNN